MDLCLYTLKNKSEQTGIIKTEIIQKPNKNGVRAYLLKMIYDKNANIKQQIRFRPEKFTTTRVMYGNAPYDVCDVYSAITDATKRYFLSILKNYKIKEFFEKYQQFKQEHPNFSQEKEKHYQKLKIPKEKPGEFRDIDSPREELKELQRMAYEILIDIYKIETHDAAFGYVKQRSCVENAQRHVYSNYVVKLDIKNCFPSITEQFIRQEMLKHQIFALTKTNPNKLTNNEEATLIKDLNTLNNAFLNAIVDIGTLKGVLPQGSPLSPHLLNLVLVAFDEEITKEIQNLTRHKGFIMYTRYSDDLTFSSCTRINSTVLVKEVEFIIKHINAPFKINKDKVRTIKTTQRCYITGVKINKDNNVSYGHEKKEILKKDLFNILMEYKKGNIDYHTNANVLGNISFMYKVEPTYTKNLITKYANKFHIPIKRIYKELLKV